MSLKEKRKRNTTSDQYQLYLQYMEADYNFRSGTINPTLGDNYIENKWEELCDKLNALGDGPLLSVEEWKKRFSDWKYSTKAKYRKLDQHRKKTGAGPQSSVAMSNLEERGLSVWGKVAVTGAPGITTYDGIIVDHVEPIMKSTPFNIIEFVAVPGCSTELAAENDATDIGCSSAIPGCSKASSATAYSTQARPQRRRPKALSVLAEKLIDVTNNQTQANADMTNAIERFFSKYIDVENNKLENEKIKLKFEIAKYKHENKDFVFDIE